MSGEGAAFCAGAVLGIMLGAIACGVVVKTTYQREAIENGAAHYDPKTGDWQWNDAEELKK